MNINITGRHFELKDSTRAYFRSQIEAILPYVESVTSTQLIVEQVKHNIVCEFKLHTSHKDFIAKAESEKLSKSFHDVAHKVIKQLKKHYDKMGTFENVSIKDIPAEIDEL